MVLLTIQIKPYRDRSNNQLVALSQIKCVRRAAARARVCSTHCAQMMRQLTCALLPYFCFCCSIFLFLFTGLLLQTNPDGITSDRMLFSVIVGMLTTSIVVFTFYLFARELFWQLMAALHEVDEDEAAEEAAWEAAELAELEAKGLLMLEDGDGNGSDGFDSDEGAWHGPPLKDSDEEEEYDDGPPSCTRRCRGCLICVVIIALALGLGIGLGTRAKHGPGAVDIPTVAFTLVISRGPTLAGNKKQGIVVNGTSPGPTLRVPFGSRMQVTVINELADDTTVVHWHGMDQRGTPFMDGVIGTTQCGIPNVDGQNSFVYSFVPQRPGTFWYHGHYNAQYPDGLYGMFVVDDGGAAIAGAMAAARNGTAAPNGTSALPYDADTWSWLVTDWYSVPAASLLPKYLAAGGGDEPLPDLVLVNGLRSGGALTHTTSRSTRQLVRVVNTGAISMWRIAVDGMPLQLVEIDGTAIEPLSVPFVEMNVAQRCAFVLDFSKLHPSIAAAPAIWFRVSAMASMYRTYDPSAPDLGLYGAGSNAPFVPTWSGLIRFSSDTSGMSAAAAAVAAAAAGSTAMPNYTAVPPDTLPAPVDMPNLYEARSWPLMPAPDPTHTLYAEIIVVFDENGVRRALMNGATFSEMSMGTQVSTPMLHTYMTPEGGPLSEEDAPLSGRLTGSSEVPFVLPSGAVVDVLINNTDGGEHPWHLHGHNFWVIATSAAPGAEQKYAPNYVRRDVISVPGNGWGKFRFVADNPGTWMWHCHLDWCVVALQSPIACMCSHRHHACICRHMHIGMIATIVEAPAALAQAAKDGSLVVPDWQKGVCSAPLANPASSSAMRRQR